MRPETSCGNFQSLLCIMQHCGNVYLITWLQFIIDQCDHRLKTIGCLYGIIFRLLKMHNLRDLLS